VLYEHSNCVLGLLCGLGGFMELLNTTWPKVGDRAISWNDGKKVRHKILAVRVTENGIRQVQVTPECKWSRDGWVDVSYFDAEEADKAS